MISILVIVGPTAVGKSETAILVARELGGEIISADSRQFYTGLEVGSGAPAREWLEQVPHHFVGATTLAAPITAGEFGRVGRVKIEEAANRGKIPIVVGGSGLYVRALVQGLAPMPPASTKRHRLQTELKERGFEALFAELNAADPEYARLVSPTTPKRLIRALEVQRLSGKPFSEWHRKNQPKPWCRPLTIGLERPRRELREIIDRRTRAMIANGWLDEVGKLLSVTSKAEDFPPAAREAVGYRLLAEVLTNKRSLEEATTLIVTATRQFAKRQMTWFRADKTTEWLMGCGSDAPKIWAAEIVERWRSFQSVRE